MKKGKLRELMTVRRARARRTAKFAKRAVKRTYKWYQKRGLVLVSNAIDWAEKEGRISKEKAEFFREQIREGKLDDFLTGLKAHLLLSAIPVVSIAGSPLRASYTIGARVKTRIQMKRKKISVEEFKRAMQLHSHAAIAFSAVPFVGFLAYVLSNSIRDPELMSIVANYSLYRYIKTPYYKIKAGIQFAGRPLRPYIVFSLYAGKKILKRFRRPVLPKHTR